MMNQEHLAIASVPVQKWEPPISKEESLKTGTIFPSLIKPFWAAENQGLSEPSSTPLPTDSLTKTPVPEHAEASECSKEQEQKMQEIQEISFVLDDLRLFLDTHPDNIEGLNLLKTTIEKRSQLLREFALAFYPLTMDCMADIYAAHPDSLCYCWQKGPIPWEGACV